MVKLPSRVGVGTKNSHPPPIFDCGIVDGGPQIVEEGTEPPKTGEQAKGLLVH